MTGSLNIAELIDLCAKFFSGLSVPDWLMRFISAFVTASGAFALATYINPQDPKAGTIMFLLTLPAYLHLSLGIHFLKLRNHTAALVLYSGILTCIAIAAYLKGFSIKSDWVYLIIPAIIVLLYLFPSGNGFRGLRNGACSKPITVTLAWILSLLYVSDFPGVFQMLPSLLCLLMALALAADLAHYRKDTADGVLTIPGLIGKYWAASICGILYLISTLIFPEIQDHPEWLLTHLILLLLLIISVFASKDSRILYMLMDASLWLPFLLS